LSIQTAEDLFIEELKDIYSAEKQAVRAYPRRKEWNQTN